MGQEEEAAYLDGWEDGYRDEQPNNPYSPSTIFWSAYEQGYKDGSRDC